MQGNTISISQLDREQRDRLHSFAVLTTKEYPQYDGYFDDWILARATRTVKYKSSAVLAAGRYVLASPDLKTWFDPDTGHCCEVMPGTLRLLRR